MEAKARVVAQVGNLEFSDAFFFPNLGGHPTDFVTAGKRRLLSLELATLWGTAGCHDSLGLQRCLEITDVRKHSAGRSDAGNLTGPSRCRRNAPTELEIAASATIPAPSV